ncbi:MAG: SMP-30/gluconolactonase/LRE family protein [Candidatus Binataceae bacterium]
MTAVALLALMTGCATQKPVGEPLRLVWPAPPEKTRIEFVRTITGQKDLHEDTTFTQSVVNFLAGIKPPPDELVEPMAVAVSDDGSVVYVSDTGQNAVFVFDFGKRKFRKIGGMNVPLGIALDDEQNLYVVEQGRKGVGVFSPEGEELRFLTDPSLERPTGIALDRERKRIYLADTAHTRSKEHTVKIFSLDGKLIGKIGKGRGQEPGQFMFPTYVTLDREGNLYVTDSLNCRVQMFDPDGKYLRSFGERGDAWGQFTLPKGVALDSFGNLYVADSGWSNVQIFNRAGQILLFFGGRGPLPGMLKNPTGVAIDTTNHIYVGDFLNHRVEEYRLVNTTAADSLPASGAAPASPAKQGGGSPGA